MRSITRIFLLVSVMASLTTPFAAAQGSFVVDARITAPEIVVKTSEASMASNGTVDLKAEFGVSATGSFSCTKDIDVPVYIRGGPMGFASEPNWSRTRFGGPNASFRLPAGVYASGRSRELFHKTSVTIQWNLSSGQLPDRIQYVVAGLFFAPSDCLPRGTAASQAAFVNVSRPTPATCDANCGNGTHAATQSPTTNSTAAAERGSAPAGFVVLPAVLTSAMMFRAWLRSRHKT